MTDHCAAVPPDHNDYRHSTSRWAAASPDVVVQRAEQRSWHVSATLARGASPLATGEGAYFHDNVVVHDEADEAVRLKNPGAQCLVSGQIRSPTYSWKLCNRHVEANRYNTDRIDDLAVGDFDGAGQDHVFLANGTAGWYSSAGRTD